MTLAALAAFSGRATATILLFLLLTSTGIAKPAETGFLNRTVKLNGETYRFQVYVPHNWTKQQKWPVILFLHGAGERGDDGLILANHFISQFKQQLRKKTRGLSSEVEDIFRKYSWPGNVRELRNVIERVMILEDGDLITTKYLPRDLILPEYHRPIVTAPLASPPAQQVTSAPPPVESKPPSGSQHMFQLPAEGISIDEVEMSLVQQAMQLSGGNQTNAAKLLRISRDQLRYRLKKLEGN